jgi:hypothetical protein
MRRVSQRSVECAIVGVPALAIFVWWTLQAGGYFERDWIPGTLLLLVIGASSVIGLRGEVAIPSRAAAAALAAFAAYVLWSFASILWAGTPADALEGSQRALAYLVWFTVFALLPWTPRAVLAAVLAFVATMTVIGAVTLLRLTDDVPLAERFIDGSLLGPVGYHNASAALFTMAAVPAVMLAARHELPVWLRPLLLAAATLMLGLAALGQSRGWLFTLPLVAAAALLLSPDRLKLALFAAPVFGALALAAADVLAVGRAGAGLTPAAAEPAMRPALDSVATTLVLVTAGTFAAAIALLAVERRWTRRAALGARARRALSVALTGAVLVGATTAALVAAGGHPIDGIDSAWADFTDVHYDDSAITSLGSGRYDFWRVAVDGWLRHPVLGLGQDNFIELYAQRRRTSEEPRWIHSLPLRMLAHTGVIGAALFAAFVVAIAGGATRTWRLADEPFTRVVVGAALVPGVVWIAHGSVDWLWELPALSAAALAFAGAAVALGRANAPPDARGSRSRRTQRRIAGAAVAAGLLGGAILVPSFVADRDVAIAEQTWRGDPAGAYAQLDRAATLNPLSPQPGLAAGRIAQERGDLARARSGFGEAAARRAGAQPARPAHRRGAATRRHERAAAVRRGPAATRRAPQDPAHPARLTPGAARPGRRCAGMHGERAIRGEPGDRASRMAR